MRKLILVLCLLSVTLPSGQAPAAPAVFPIQPGAGISTPIGGCTLNFVYEDAQGTLYIGTAGHCANVGHRIRAGNVEFGTVVYSENAYPIIDFALILIDPEDYHLVSPAVRYWGGPTGLFQYGEGQRGDRVMEYGYGMGYSSTEYTRRRVGVLSTVHPQRYSAALNCIFGDSGGPVLHGPTGKALGVVDVLQIPGTAGSLISYGLNRARILTGIDVTLVTAPLEPFPQI